MATNPFIASIWPHILQASQATGVDPRIIAAQAALESGYGRHAPGNNLFGIKSHGQGGGNTLATTEVVNGQPVRTSATFRAYDSPADSVMGYADFINANPRYKPLKQAQGLDAQLAALQTSGYATDPNYAQKVGSIARSLDGVTSAPLPDAMSREAIEFVQNNPQPGGFGPQVEGMVFGSMAPSNQAPAYQSQPADASIPAESLPDYYVRAAQEGKRQTPGDALVAALKALGDEPPPQRPPLMPLGASNGNALLEAATGPRLSDLFLKRRLQGLV